MEHYGYKYIHKITQFGTTMNSRKNCSIDSMAETVNNSDSLFILYRKPPREYRKPNCRIGDRVRIFRYDPPFRKGYKPQFTRDAFEIVAIFSKEPPIYTIKDVEDGIIRGL